MCINKLPGGRERTSVRSWAILSGAMILTPQNPNRCRANMAQVRQSRPDSGLDLPPNSLSCSLLAQKRNGGGPVCAAGPPCLAR